MLPDRPDSPYLASALLSSGKNDHSPLVQCTKHMCPIRVHWHVKANYKAYWRVKITITNFNYKMNYSQWNLVVQHPNFENLTQIFSFNYEPLVPYGPISEFSFPLTKKYNFSNTFELSNWFDLLQMILLCFGESNITMICWCRVDLLEMFNQRSYFRRINRSSPLTRDGLSLERFTLTVTIVLCHPLMLIHTYQMLVPILGLLYFTLWSQFWSLLFYYIHITCKIIRKKYNWRFSLLPMKSIS